MGNRTRLELAYGNQRLRVADGRPAGRMAVSFRGFISDAGTISSIITNWHE